MRITLRKVFTWIAACLPGILLEGHVSAAPGHYVVTDLGLLPGFSESFASSINASGDVVGGLRTSTGEFRAFIWNQSEGMRDIGTLGGNFSEAVAINDHGTVVGASYDAVGAQRAFLYVNGMMRALGSQASSAYGVNNLNQVVGTGQSGAFVWDSTFGFRFIGGILASGINDIEEVVGTRQVVGTGATHAFLYSRGNIIDLGTLGGGNSDAYDINNTGQVVGRSHADLNDALHAFLYSDESMIDLGTFPTGSQSTAYGINDLGSIVGDATVATGTHQAFLYEDGVLYNLNDLIGTSAGWTLERAEDLNNAGQVVGFGIIGGERHAFLLTPGSPYRAIVRPPIDPSGSSVFTARRGIIPIKFRLEVDGVPTCTLPPATIEISRSSGDSSQAIGDTIDSASADCGSFFRIADCQYICNAQARLLGPGSYQVEILIEGSAVGSAVFGLE